MSSSSPRVRAVSTDQAIIALTDGVSTLSVKAQNRRVLFVESVYDQSIYQLYYALLKSKLSSDVSLEFLGSGKQGSPGGCDRVESLVSDLRSAGLDTVSGVVDRDNRITMPDHLHCVADRYAIENLVLDPLQLAGLLLREHIVDPLDFNLPSYLRHFELNSEHAPQLIEAISAKMGFDMTQSIPVDYVGGFSVTVPRQFLDCQGHALQARIVAEYPQLNRFKPSELLMETVRRSSADLPHFIPASLLDLFKVLVG